MFGMLLNHFRPACVANTLRQVDWEQDKPVGHMLEQKY